MNMQRNLENKTLSGQSDFGMSIYSEVILIVNGEALAREDKCMLQRTGFNSIQTFSSAIEAIENIVRKRKQKLSYSCLVVCHEQFMDMDASALISLLSLHPNTSSLPVMVILNSQNDEKFSLDSSISPLVLKEKYSSLGAFEVLNRPVSSSKVYEQAKFAYSYFKKRESIRANTLLNLKTLAPKQKASYLEKESANMQTFKKAFSRFMVDKPATIAKMSYENAYNVACEKLQNKLYNQAKKYFKHAISVDSPYKAAGLFGMYQLSKEVKAVVSAKLYLMQSFQTFIDNSHWDWAEKCALRFSKEFPQASHPILGLITTAIKRSDLFQLKQLLGISVKIFGDEEIARSVVTGCFQNEFSEEILQVLSSEKPVFVKVLEMLQEHKIEKEMREQELTLKNTLLQNFQDHATREKNTYSDFFETGLENVSPELLEKIAIQTENLSFESLVMNDVPLNDLYLEELAKKDFAKSNSQVQREDDMKKYTSKKIRTQASAEIDANLLKGLASQVAVIKDDNSDQLDKMNNQEIIDMYKDMENDKPKISMGEASKGGIESLPLVMLGDKTSKSSIFGDFLKIAKQTARFYRKTR